MMAGGVIALLVALIGTPLAWRATRGAARWPRIAVVTLACIGAAGALSLPFSGGADPTAFAALLLSLVVQGFVLPFLVFLPRKAP